MNSRVKIAFGLAVATGVALLAPAAADAAPRGGSFAFCNASSAPEYVTFPVPGGGSASSIQRPGKCFLTFFAPGRHLAVVHRLHANGSESVVGRRYSNGSEDVNWSV